MAPFYRVVRADGVPRDRPPFIAGISREFLLPAMDCPQCGVWGADGLVFPGISKAELPSRLQSLGAQPISVPKWRALGEVPGFAARHGIDVRPGATFGPLLGHPVTTGTGLVWRNDWTLLVDEGHASLLAQLRCPLVTVPSPCMNAAGQRMLEIDIREGVAAVAKGSPGRPPTACAGCGRIKPGDVDESAVRFTSAQLVRPLQRIAGRPTIIIATESFVAAAKRLRLTTFTAVAVRALRDG
jgi:hypothetical protein